MERDETEAEAESERRRRQMTGIHITQRSTDKIEQIQLIFHPLGIIAACRRRANPCYSVVVAAPVSAPFIVLRQKGRPPARPSVHPFVRSLPSQPTHSPLPLPPRARSPPALCAARSMRNRYMKGRWTSLCIRMVVTLRTAATVLRRHHRIPRVL